MRKICLLGVLMGSVCAAQSQAPTGREIEAMVSALNADLRGAENMEPPGPASPRTLPRAAEDPVSVTQLRQRPLKNAQKSVARGLKFSAAGDHRQAAEEFQKAVAADPQFAIAFDRLGVEYAQLGRYSDAEANLRRAQSLDPANWVSYYDLGVLLYQTGDLPEAERSLRQALELSRANVKVHTLLGVLLWRSVETRAEALEHLKFAARSSAEAKELLASLEGK